MTRELAHPITAFLTRADDIRKCMSAAEAGDDLAVSILRAFSWWADHLHVIEPPKKCIICDGPVLTFEDTGAMLMMFAPALMFIPICKSCADHGDEEIGRDASEKLTRITSTLVTVVHDHHGMAFSGEARTLQ